MKKKTMMKMTGIALGIMMMAGLAGCGQTDDVQQADTQEETAAEETAEEEPAADATAEESTEAAAEESTETADAAEETETEEPVGDEEVGDYPSNFMEERTEKYEYDSYDEIISCLEDGEAYGYGKVMGYDDEDMLFITNEVFTGYDEPAAIEVYPYFKYEDGKYRCGGVLVSDSTGTPISLSDEGYIMIATHTTMEKMAVDQDTKGLMDVEYVYVVYGEDENNTYGGFIRETNSVFGAETEIAEDSSTEFEQAFEDFDKSTPIAFTVVGEN